jgi:hypothetical protein
VQHHRPHLHDIAAHDAGPARCDRHGLVDVVALQPQESAEVLLQLDERPIDDGQFAVGTLADTAGLLRMLQLGAAVDDFAELLPFVEAGPDPVMAGPSSCGDVPSQLPAPAINMAYFMCAPLSTLMVAHRPRRHRTTDRWPRADWWCGNGFPSNDEWRRDRFDRPADRFFAGFRGL